LVFAALLVSDVATARGTLGRISAKPRLFRDAVAKLPKKPNIVFVRYSTRRNMHIALVENRGMLPGAGSWNVPGRGPDGPRLYAAANGRTAYVFDEATGEFHEARP